MRGLERHDDKKLSLDISDGGRARDQCGWRGDSTRHARRDGTRDDVHMPESVFPRPIPPCIIPRPVSRSVPPCTLGDLVIAACALTLALLLVGAPDWPRDRFWPVAILTVAFGLAYTAFSEWRNVVARASWAYSDWMPVIPIAGLSIGVSPLLQWIVVPAAAFAITGRGQNKQNDGGRP